MEWHLSARRILEGIMSHITKTRNIERLYIALEIPAEREIKNELEELINELVESREIAEQMIQEREINEPVVPNPHHEMLRVFEEDEDDHIKRVARLEREILNRVM